MSGTKCYKLQESYLFYLFVFVASYNVRLWYRIASGVLASVIDRENKQISWKKMLVLNSCRLLSDQVIQKSSRTLREAPLSGCNIVVIPLYHRH